MQSVVRIPLFATRPGEDESVPIGKVEVIANSSHESLAQLSYFLEHAEELQAQVSYLVDNLGKKNAAARKKKTNAASASTSDTLVGSEEVEAVHTS